VKRAALTAVAARQRQRPMALPSENLIMKREGERNKDIDTSKPVKYV
jgi:hypothetical protein